MKTSFWLTTNRYGDLYKSFRRGVRLLDRKLGTGWRKVIKRHKDQFDFTDGSHCVLGTLEHFSGRMKALKTKKIKTGHVFEDAQSRLNIANTAYYGFDVRPGDEQDVDYAILEQMWLTEVEGGK